MRRLSLKPGSHDGWSRDGVPWTHAKAEYLSSAEKSRCNVGCGASYRRESAQRRGETKQEGSIANG